MQTTNPMLAEGIKRYLIGSLAHTSRPPADATPHMRAHWLLTSNEEAANGVFACLGNKSLLLM